MQICVFNLLFKFTSNNVFYFIFCPQIMQLAGLPLIVFTREWKGKKNYIATKISLLKLTAPFT